ncbi:SDR family NAD(P)-dependent oxidoreductase [Cryobacterium sp. CG_9.6]|uniref:SDR family NAD(P)-dependent oxidoreductase n=1 Tax=Cryobacterium sp. CG_9.6 TaxID=2760710 RepID=UPI002473D0C7|nr:SDR family NAD(P)-dependent oxidoreductase [Cryobacterium sp. CG_9.6]MDH6238126.1 NAD(P)-dependent dehydrogenase (short-subunit alcohol dehydrogenase family) [Cryobacterium sp. CG_9.6]
MSRADAVCPSQRLAGKTAIVFGGGSVGGQINNGLAAALAYAAAAANVFVVDMSAAAVEGALAELERYRSASGSTVRVGGTIADVTDSARVLAAVDACVESVGRPNILHNNVGIARMGGPIEMSVEEWDTVLNVNLTSAFITTKHVLPHMLALGGGAIVNIGSIGGMRYLGYNYPSYSATKGGLTQFTVNVALEYASRGIRANCIAPGLIETPMMYQQIAGSYDSVEDMLAKRNALSPTGMMGDSFDIAHAAVFLASDEARYINGTCLPVDGGLTAAVAQ